MPADALVAAACLLAAAVADRLLALLAVRLVARHIAAAVSVAPAPRVRIIGAPFLTQLAAGRFRDVRVAVPPFTSGSVDIDGLDVRLTQVRAAPARRLAGVTLVAGQAAGTMTVSFAALADRLPGGLTLTRRGGELRIAGSLMRMPVSGSLRIVAEPRLIGVTPVVLGVPSLVGFALAVPWLPPEMVISAVLVTDRGLEVSVRGENVVLAAGRRAAGPWLAGDAPWPDDAPVGARKYDSA